MRKHAVLLLIPIKDKSLDMVKQMVADSGVNARYNIGKIHKMLAESYAPIGAGTIFPISALDTIFDPIDVGDYSDFDISRYWSHRENMDIKRRGNAQYAIAACYASTTDLKSLCRYLSDCGKVYFWVEHYWHSLNEVA